LYEFAMNCYLLNVYINSCNLADDQVEDEYIHDLVEVGPLIMIISDVLKRMKTAVENISSSPVPFELENRIFLLAGLKSSSSHKQQITHS
jgi:hypothetical protein